MPGRAVDGSNLVRWWLDYGKPDLFSGNDEPGALEVVIDADVFLDFVDNRNDESKGLLADWLRPLMTICYTAELLNDLNHNEDAATRRRRSAEAQQFRMLRCTPEEYQQAEQRLRPIFPTFKTENDESDFRHLVRALAAEADAFVTRDGNLLGTADAIFDACGLSVVRPGEMIGRIDVIEHEREYQRSFVAGTKQVVQERINSADDTLIAAIQRDGERQRNLEATLNQYLANPQRYRCEKLTSDGATVAALVVESGSGVDRVPLLRICSKRRAGTLARAVLTGLVRKAVSTGSNGVFVTETACPKMSKRLAVTLAFCRCKAAG